jgi:hypothetical protein
LQLSELVTVVLAAKAPLAAKAVTARIAVAACRMTSSPSAWRSAARSQQRRIPRGAIT